MMRNGDAVLGWVPRAATTLVTWGLLAGPALAQTHAQNGAGAVVRHGAGATVAIVRTPTLAPDTWYELQSYDLQPLPPNVADPETVITVRGGRTVDAHTIAGADGCATPGGSGRTDQSCVRFRTPDLLGPLRLFVWVRAAETAMAGTARLRIQRVDSDSAVPQRDNCEGWPAAHCWFELGRAENAPGSLIQPQPVSAFAFGGLVVPISMLGDGLGGPLQLETTPYRDSARHAPQQMILFAGEHSDAGADWFLAPNASPFSGAPLGGPSSNARSTYGTAHYIGTLAELRRQQEGAPELRTVVVSSNTGVQLLRNDRILLSQGGGVSVGRDADGDGLGAGLEAALRTCDSRTSPNEGGPSCDLEPACSDPDVTVCRAAHRDSDQDGLPDAMEVYGVPPRTGQPASGQALPRWGADPARFDVFVEVDYVPTDDPPEPASCDGVPGPTPPRRCEAFWKRQARVYERLAEVENRDGTTGIAMHFDVGPVPTPSARDETRFGDWGGSTSPPGDQRDVDPIRAWIFRNIAEFAGGGGQTSSPMYSSASVGYSVVHELGHQATGFRHAGGQGRYGLYEDGLANYNPLYLSRMNYAFENYASEEVTSDPDRAGAPTVSDELGFMGSSSTVEWNLRALDEQCPFGPDVDPTAYYPGNVVGNDWVEFVPPEALPPVSRGSSSCYPVDWNHNGVIDTEPVSAPAVQTGRISRAWEREGAFFWRGGGADVTVAGDALVWSVVRPTEVSPGRWDTTLEVHRNAAIRCNECPQQRPGPQFPACWTPAQDRVYTLDGVHPNAMTSEGLRIEGDWKTLFVYRTGGLLNYAILHEEGWYRRGEVSREAGRLMGSGEEGLLGMARVDDRSVLLAFRHYSSGTVYTLSGRDGTSWSSPQQALLENGRPIRIHQGTSPEIARVWGAYGSGLLLVYAEPGGEKLQVARRLSNGRFRVIPELEIDNLDAPLNMRVRGKPNLIQSRYGGSDRLLATWLGASEQRNMVPVWAETIPNRDEWLRPVWFHLDIPSPFPPALVFDDRDPNGPAVRAYHAQIQACQSTDDCAEPGGLCQVLRRRGLCSQTDAPCETSSACTAAGETCEFATESDRTYCFDVAMSYGKELLLPFADGIPIGRLYAYEDQSVIAHGFCRTLHECNDCEQRPVETNSRGTPIPAEKLCKPLAPFELPCTRP